jgi:hypothetical protein
MTPFWAELPPLPRWRKHSTLVFYFIKLLYMTFRLVFFHSLAVFYCLILICMREINSSTVWTGDFLLLTSLDILLVP